METLQFILFVFQLIISVLLVLIILMQKTSEDSMQGIGGGASMGQGLVSTKTVQKAITKTTIILAFLFILNSLMLGIIVSRTSGANNSKVNEFLQKTQIEQVNTTESAAIPEAE